MFIAKDTARLGGIADLEVARASYIGAEVGGGETARRVGDEMRCAGCGELFS